jgi:hypothetical protein
MSTDRELLQLAAKAAGYVVQGHTLEGAWVYDPTAPRNADGEYQIFLWRPRHDDGDALRLAVKLGIHLGFYGDHVAAQRTAGKLVTEQRRDGDVQAATRSAILRVAAAAGEAMP